MSEPSRASLALARKWRPRSFATLVGQEHVVRALTHALATRRLHHAYLLTGTRGVGKTTIARILAKALNCEVRGLGHPPDAEPCGACRACVEIDAQRFPDYIELDAASNRGVDEMTQLLENAVYAPVAGRYKVYVIDEVHMLSAHAFNAMLKTLEEPPGHVVFILATTDPQKVPVTVLSRCLQFGLKNMSPTAIARHLAHVLAAEGVAFEAPALDAIGRAAAGSMRDALSLLDQAIAFGAGRVSQADVAEMLGMVDRTYLAGIVDALIEGDARAALAVADEMAERGLSFAQALAELATLLHRIALAQVGAAGDTAVDPGTLAHWAQAIDPLDLQVYYQIAVHAGRDLPLAPDEHAGFTMALLRLFAFRPEAAGPKAAAPVSVPAAVPARAVVAGTAGASATASGPERLPAGASGAQSPASSLEVAPPAANSVPASPASTPQVSTPQVSTPSVSTPSASRTQATPAPSSSPSASTTPATSPMEALRAALVRPRRLQPATPAASVPPSGATRPAAPPPTAAAVAQVEPIEAAGTAAPAAASTAPAPAAAAVPAAAVPAVDEASDPFQASPFDGDWPALAAALPAAGLAREFLLQSELLAHADGAFHVRVPIRPLAEAATVSKVREVLARRFGRDVRLAVEVGAVRGATAAAAASQHDAERQQQARDAIQADPFVRTLLSDFGGTIVPGSIRPH